jgi:hypothetical protein
MTQPPTDPGQFSGDPDPQRQPIPVMPLEYGLRDSSRSGSWAAFFARIVAGFLGFILLSLGWVRTGAALRLNPGVILIGWLVMTAALLGLAVFVRNRYGRAGYGYGILLVFAALFGIILLIIGLCWRQ